jgi:hypothetical protein
MGQGAGSDVTHNEAGWITRHYSGAPSRAYPCISSSVLESWSGNWLHRLEIFMISANGSGTLFLARRDKLIETAAQTAGKTKADFILDAIDEKLERIRTLEQTMRDLAGWLSHEEAEEVPNSVSEFGHDFS